jgi:excinuclease UvrABC helicase subunit UvrB
VRDSFCTGSPCICITHPRYKEFSQKINIFDEAIKKICLLKVQAGNERQRLLQKAFYAKQRYFAQKTT